MAQIFRTQFCEDIFTHKYKHEQCETWEALSKTLIREVCGKYLPEEQLKQLEEQHSEMKCIAGGRYLYYAGRGMKYYNNCFLFKSFEDSREDWAYLSWKAESCLMTGGGIGNDYSIYRSKGSLLSKTGGFASGPISKMKMINETGREVMQGGSRRCLLPDSLITMSDGGRKKVKDVIPGDEVHTRFGPKRVLAKVNQGVQDIIKITTDKGVVQSSLEHRWLALDRKQKKFIRAKELTIDSKLYWHPFHVKTEHELSDNLSEKEAYVLGHFMGNGCAYSSNRTHEVTFQIAEKHYSDEQSNLIKEVMSEYANPIQRQGHGKCVEIRCRGKELVYKFQEYKKPHCPPKIPDFIYTSSLKVKCAFLSGWFDTDGCFTNSWKLSNKHIDTLIDVQRLCSQMGFHTTLNGLELRFCDYQRMMFIELLKPYSFKLKNTNCEVYHKTNEIPVSIVHIEQAGQSETYDIQIEDVEEFIADDFVSHNSAIYASLNWRHPDAGEFLHCKDWNAMPVSGAYDENGNNITIGYLKEKDFNYPAPLDMTNISLNYDNAFLEELYGRPYDELYEIYKIGGYKAVSDLPIVKIPLTFLENCRQALKTGEPGFSFNFFEKEKETARNACQPSWATVLTPEGIKTFNEIDVGSLIWSTEGWTKVVKKWSTGVKPVYKISFQDGNEFVGTLDHELIIESNTDELKKENVATILKNNLKVYCFNSSPQSILNKFTEDPNLISNRFTTPLSHISDKSYSIQEVYKITVDNSTHTYWTGGVNVANCTEVTSEDDSDVCNLGSINMAKINTIEEFESIVRNKISFLVCGTLEAELPYEKVYEIRAKNRRLGLGLMGVHEWLLKRGYKYEVVPELHEWLKVYKEASEDEGRKLCEKLGVSIPIAYRAIAPTGSIGILAGTSTGIEPLFAVAYKRRYLKGMKEWHFQYVVDGTAKILIDQFNINPDSIETSIDLASDYERRIKFQADIQDYVDMSISSTINMPKWGTELNNDTKVEDFARVLAKYVVRLRGFTCYPDGARGGQPLVPVDYYEALSNIGQEFKEQFHDVCDITNKGGTCGS